MKKERKLYTAFWMSKDGKKVDFDRFAYVDVKYVYRAMGRLWESKNPFAALYVKGLKERGCEGVVRVYEWAPDGEDIFVGEKSIA